MSYCGVIRRKLLGNLSLPGMETMYLKKNKLRNKDYWEITYAWECHQVYGEIKSSTRHG